MHKFIPHTADIKFHVQARTIEGAFLESAMVLKKIIIENKKTKNKKNKKIQIKGKDLESLLYNFLEEFLYLIDAKNFLFNEIKEIKIDEKNFKLTAVILGDDISNYKINNKVKAITYNDMIIKHEKDKWIIEAVLDI
ncbi:MAG: archease [Nanoarchaeota archaeon]